MKTALKKILPVTTIAIVLLCNATLYAGMENIHDLQLNDGSVIYGKVMQINAEKVANAAYNDDLENNQNSGYGLRGSIMVRKIAGMSINRISEV